jgi:hypothetical protein
VTLMAVRLMPVRFVAQCASINAFITLSIPSSTVILMEIVLKDGLENDICIF